MNFHENDITKMIVDIGFHIHKLLGPGLFESVYEEVMYVELIKAGLEVDRQKAIPVIWEGRKMELGFRADLIVSDKVIIEIKCIRPTNPILSIPTHQYSFAANNSTWTRNNRCQL